MLIWTQMIFSFFLYIYAMCLFDFKKMINAIFYQITEVPWIKNLHMN
jgi:hypothetical protein